MIKEWEKSKDEPTDKFIEKTLWIINKMLNNTGKFSDPKYRAFLVDYIFDQIMSNRHRFKPSGGNGSIIAYFCTLTKSYFISVTHKNGFQNKYNDFQNKLKLHKRSETIKKILSE